MSTSIARRLLLAAALCCAAAAADEHATRHGASVADDDADAMLAEGKETFRYDAFGDEDFWGGELGLHKAIAGAAHGGVGPGVSPATALALGLKVDVRALPSALVQKLKAGKVDLDDPATTLALLSLDAVVGVKGFFDDGGRLTSVGITCALCHSTVDDSFAPGIGHRLDGWPNRDLDVGAIIDAAPSVDPFVQVLGVDEPTVRKVLKSWGPGRFDAQLILDGQAFRPDGKTSATLIPPAFGLAGVNLHTSTGWGSVPYWNAFVAVLEMHGKGNFFDPRLKDSAKFPVASANNFDDVRADPDLVTPKLAALQFYQLSLDAPAPPRGSFDARAAKRGEALFAADGKARCASCHVPPLFTEPGWNMHTADEIGIDDFQARRSPDERYRTTPLKGAWSHAKGGYYHDGRFETLADVVAHYDSFLNLGLSKQEQRDLVEYLKSL
ncbi:MAG TPA: hypothetical protein VFV10_17665 [Gammaproteobacteria bacterium]|nr:hypothetical protein [Gammaproteobacteria bacterium]